MADLEPIHFIGETITVEFEVTPTYAKRTGCPDRFVWQDATYAIVEVVNEWHDYGRRGRMASNMRPEHAAQASQHGSWGVGRDYYRVRTTSGQFFDLYYDRAPTKAGDRKGGWYLYRELGPRG